jgi:Tfp pilus assembly protein PilF
LFFGLAYFVLMLLPVLGFLNIYFMRYSLVADHWQYFAIIGPIVLAAALIRKPVVAAALLLALGALTWKQCGMYGNAETLWQTTLRLDPNCWMAHNNLGNLLLQRRRMDEAVIHYQKALQIRPDYADAHNDLGIVLMQMGKVDEAVSHFQNALQIKPDSAQAHNNLGLALLQTGRLDEAIPHLQQALQINPGYAQAHNNLGNALLQKGREDQAIVHFQNALQIDPADMEVQNNLAWLLATCAQASLRDGNKAVQLARRANELAGGTNPIILHTLAAAFAEAGQFSEAVETAQRALSLAGAQSNTALAGALQSEIKLYQAGKPFRTPEQTH